MDNQQTGIKIPTNFFGKIKSKLTKKRLIFGSIVILIVLFVIFRGGNNTAEAIQTDSVKKQDLKQTVLATGQVTSQTDLALAFKVSGIVNSVSVKVGDNVKKGHVLANLDQKDQVARFTQARGSLAQAQANYQKVLDGASNEEVAAAQVTLDSAKKTLEDVKRQQQMLVNNAYSTLLSSGLEAVADPGNAGAVTATITGAYNSTEQGSYKVRIYTSGSLRFQYDGLEIGSGEVRSAPQPLGTRGLYIQFSASAVPANNFWTINIPNTQSSSYVTYYNAYNSSLETQKSAITTAENAVASAKAALDLKVAKARPAELDSVYAAVISAQGQVQAASADLENTLIRAPADGTITSVDVKPGELASALKQILILQDVDNLHIEANVSEANIANIKVGQDVDVTFDALGSDRHFKAKVAAIDPASTLVSGVVNYKVTINLDKLEEVKPGMTANITILTAEKEGVLAAPLRSVLSHDGKKFVRVILDSKKKTYEEKEVILGMEADGGLVEVVSGLSAGQEIVTFVKSK